MTEKFTLTVTHEQAKIIDSVLEWYKGKGDTPSIIEAEDLSDDIRPPVRFITLEPYSNYITKIYPDDEYSEITSNTEYAVTVDGDKSIPVALTHWDGNGNHKQLVSFVGDNVNGEITLMLDGNKTDPIELTSSVLTVDYLKQKIGALPGIGSKNLKISAWPGRWLIEFTGKLAGKTFNKLEVIRPEDAVFQVHVLITDYADSERSEKVHISIPTRGLFDSDDDAINDAAAAGTFGEAIWRPGQGYVVMALECRDYNGDGTPDL